jgi:catechol 2,3-dioxygenase-like lactoylglutathione lyase family enzyme
VSAASPAAELFHLGLTVADIRRSIRFYVEVVGFEEAEPAENRTAQFAELTGNPAARLLTVMLASRGFRLQLIEYLDGGGETLDLHHNHVGSPHLAFFVPDVETKYAETMARGDVPVTSGLITNATETLRSFYTEDPDGMPVEFLERLDDRWRN